jgi:hypothetical protein
MLGHILYLTIAAFLVLYLVTIVISAVGHGVKGVLLLVGVALVLAGAHYPTPLGVVASTLGTLAIGSSVTLAFKETIEERL